VHVWNKIAAYKELLRVVKFVLDTKLDCLKMKKRMNYSKEWDLISHSARNWAGDAKTRISVTGFIIYLLGVPSCWR
jgi:hypothetical protein